MPCPEGVAKKALRGDDLGTPLAKNPFGSDGGRGRFAKDATKPQVTDILFSVEEIIHLAIVTVGALFVQHLAPLMPFLASDLLDSSPPAGFLAKLVIFAPGGDDSKQLTGTPWCIALG